MFFGLFDIFSCTGEGKQFKYKPIVFKISSKQTYDKLKKMLLEEAADIVNANDDYFDICYKENGFEISYLVGQDEMNHAFLTVSVYGEHKRGRTRRYLKKKLKEINEKFKDYIIR